MIEAGTSRELVLSPIKSHPHAGVGQGLGGHHQAAALIHGDSHRPAREGIGKPLEHGVSGFWVLGVGL